MDLEAIRTALGQADAAVFRWVNGGLVWKPLDCIMLLATVVGTGLFQSGVSLLFVLVGAIKDRVDLRRAGYAGLIAFAASGAMVQVAKFVWDRPRPILAMYDVQIVGGPLFVHSFPSGHTMTAFAVCAAWAVMLPRYRGLLLGVACATGFSRIYLGVHFPLDVIYGAVLGYVTGVVSGRMVPHVIKGAAGTGRQSALQES